MEIIAYKGVELRFLGIPTPNSALIDGDIRIWIEIAARERLNTFPISTMFRLAVPKVEKITLEKSHVRSHRSVEWNRPSQIVISVQVSYAQRILEPSVRSACHGGVAAPDDAGVVQLEILQKLSNSPPKHFRECN